ncbi:uncharacterized protein [Parasteatoda tepidariorum]|uniref:uncharacterized protein n=1 Tax=Parasteatoda tepidariorum TaxID=114398 RepID=UPI0039BC5633
MYSARRSIPRGRPKAYKCFWSLTLNEIKTKRDRLRRKAELTGRSVDISAWRKQTAFFKKAVLSAKRMSFERFINNLNFRENSTKTYKFLSKIQNKFSSPQRQPIHADHRCLTDETKIANAFGNFYHSSQRKRCFARKSSKVLKRKFNGPHAEDRKKDDHIFSDLFSEYEFDLSLKRLPIKKVSWR